MYIYIIIILEERIGRKQQQQDGDANGLLYLVYDCNNKRNNSINNKYETETKTIVLLR